jgi:hypothetical protein
VHLTTQRGLPRNADRLRLTRTEPTKGHAVWIPARQPVELTIHAIEDRKAGVRLSDHMRRACVTAADGGFSRDVRYPDGGGLSAVGRPRRDGPYPLRWTAGVVLPVDGGRAARGPCITPFPAGS